MTTRGPDGAASPVTDDTFVGRCLRGEVQVEAVDDAVDAWHDGGNSSTLREHLGLDEREYALWVLQPDLLHRLVERRRRTPGGPGTAPTDPAATVGGRDALVASLAALLGRARAMGLEPCAVARDAVEVALSEEIDGPGARTVRAVVTAVTAVAAGPGRVREVPLHCVAPPR